MYFSNIGEYRDMYSGHQQYKYKYSNSVKLNGKGTLKTKPDMAILTLGVITEGKELKTVQEENALKTNSLINRLKAMGINERDIQTQSYNVDIEYDYVDGKQVFRGYRVTNTIVVTIRDINKTGEIIDAAVESGANTIRGINFTVANPSLYYNQALKLAIKDAIEKAQVVENTLGVVINETPISIEEEGSQYVPIIERESLKAASTVTPIEAGTIEITARIKAIFYYTSMRNNF